MNYHNDTEHLAEHRLPSTQEYATPLKMNSNEKNTEQDKLPSMAKPLGKAVKLLRGKLRLSQSDFVARVPGRLSQSYISRVEKGLCFPRDDSLSAIVEALDCTHRELWELAESLASVNLDETNVDDILQCISHNSLGRSYEEVKLVYAALDDEVVVELDRFNRVLSNGKKLQHSQLAKIDQLLRERADALPENPATLREYIYGVLDLLMTACKEHALAAPA